MMKNETERDVLMAGESLQIPTTLIFLYTASHELFIEFYFIGISIAYIFLNAGPSGRAV